MRKTNADGHERGKAGDEGLIPKHGGYRNLKTFQLAETIYDVTVRFCRKYIDPHSRTRDQMVQAARSGRQNIAEGSVASGTSKKLELKLTNVARASLAELRLDYEDFLRQQGLGLWEPDDPRRRALVARRCATADDVAAWVKEICGRGDGQGGRDGRDGHDGRDGPDGPDGQDVQDRRGGQCMKSMRSMKSMKSKYAETAANAALVLIGVAMALLDRQIAAQAEAFKRDGGFTERLYRNRMRARR